MITFKSTFCSTFLLCCCLTSPCLQAQIKSAVGVGAANEKVDVKLVQQLLNAISDGSGGPKNKLVEDGIIGPKTIDAIKRFQRFQLGFEDGRIDPKFRTELRLLRMNGTHVLLGAADSSEEERLAEFTSSFMNVVVDVNGQEIAIRPPYYINTGKRKETAVENRKANPKVGKLLVKTLGKGEGTIGKATPQQIGEFLKAAVKEKLVPDHSPDGLRTFLEKYGVSTDCSGLASRACNLLHPENPMDVVNEANTAFMAKLSAVDSPADLEAGHLMVKGGSHVRLITDVDVTPGGIEFTTLESTASNIFPNGNGIGERRWRFVNIRKFENLQVMKGSAFVNATKTESEYIYTKKLSLIHISEPTRPY